MFTRDTPVRSHILLACVFAPFIFVINKDAVSLAAALYGPYGAGSDEETTRMSETPVLMGWKRCDLEVPRQLPRRSHWVVDTLSRRSDHCESKKLDPTTLGQARELSRCCPSGSQFSIWSLEDTSDRGAV